MAAFRAPVCFMNFWTDFLPTSLLYISILLGERERGRESEREISFGTELSECACVQYSKLEKGRGQRAHDRELHRRTEGSYWRHLTCRALTVYIKI